MNARDQRAIKACLTRWVVMRKYRATESDLFTLAEQWRLPAEPWVGIIIHEIVDECGLGQHHLSPVWGWAAMFMIAIVAAVAGAFLVLSTGVLG